MTDERVCKGCAGECPQHAAKAGRDAELCDGSMDGKRPQANHCCGFCKDRTYELQHPRIGTASDPGRNRVAVSEDGSEVPVADRYPVLQWLRDVGAAGLHSRAIREAGLSGNPSARMNDLRQELRDDVEANEPELADEIPENREIIATIERWRAHPTHKLRHGVRYFLPPELHAAADRILAAGFGAGDITRDPPAGSTGPRGGVEPSGEEKAPREARPGALGEESATRADPRSGSGHLFDPGKAHRSRGHHEPEDDQLAA